MRRLLLCLGCALLGEPLTAQTNVLLLIADDVGVDNIGAYGDPASAPTPSIDGLADQGVLFRAAYSNPICSPTRATILTGLYAWRTGVGSAIGGTTGPALSASFTTLPQVLAGVGYESAVVGKWHLGDADDLLHPLQAGFLHHWGTASNLTNYFDFEKNVDGTPVQSTTYATTDTVDDALTLLGTLSEPWLLWVAFNAAHVPFHAPPANLHGYELPASVAGNEPIHAKAMIEAMDTEIGRLLAGVDLADTLVLFVGDNGPDSLAVLPPWDPAHGKNTLYELGVNVPLIVAGAGTVEGAECSALVNTTDLFATVAEVAGASAATGLDAVSITPYLGAPGQPSLRDHAYAESFLENFDPAGGWPAQHFLRRKQGARDDRYKLILNYLPNSPLVDPDDRYLFDLVADPFETTNLLDAPLSTDAEQAYLALRSHLVLQGPSPWVDLGQALPGTYGAPSLAGEGPLVPGTTATLSLDGALEDAAGVLVIGFSVAGVPFQCGTLVPSNDLLKFITTNAEGSKTFNVSWPDFGPATPVTLQGWLLDPGSACGYAATNGLTGTTAP